MAERTPNSPYNSPNSPMHRESPCNSPNSPLQGTSRKQSRGSFIDEMMHDSNKYTIRKTSKQGSDGQTMGASPIRDIIMAGKESKGDLKFSQTMDEIDNMLNPDRK